MEQGNVTQIGDMLLKIPSQATGDVLIYNGTNWVRSAPTASGDILTSTGVGSVPTWQTPAAGGGSGEYFRNESGVALAYAHISDLGDDHYDLSPYRNIMTVSGLTDANLVPGKVSRYCYNYNGTSHRSASSNLVMLDRLPVLNIEMWIYPTSLTGNRTMCYTEGATNDIIEVGFNGTNWDIGFDTSSGTEVINGTHGLTINEWNYVFLLFDNSTTGKVYVNGVLDGTGNNAGNGTIDTDTAGMFIGSRASAQYFAGYIDGYRLILSPLYTGAEILERYNAFA